MRTTEAVGTLGCAVSLVALVALAWQTMPETSRSFLFTVCVVGLIGLFALDFRRSRPARPSSARPRAIDENLHALAGSLKSIRDDERAQFDAMHIQAMCLALLRLGDTRSEVYDEAAAYLMVDALTRVGNAHAATWLERMARTMSQERLPSGLRAAAERAAASIRERVARERAGDTLLRPAAPAEADTLLRPARGGEEREPELLLRPTNTQGDGPHGPGG